MLEDEAHLRLGANDGHAGQSDLARGGPLEAGHDPEQRGLATATLSHDGHEIAGVDVEADVVEGGMPTARALEGHADAVHGEDGHGSRGHGVGTLCMA